MASELEPCGGCGATSDRERCIGCFHDFGTPESPWDHPTPVAPVSPDATGKCGELETVGWLWEYAQYRTEDRGYYGYETVITENSPADHVSPIEKVRNSRELVTRSQAVELLAAERAEKEKLEAAWLEAEGKISDLQADNAALTARVKELEADLKTFQDGTADLVNEKIDAEFRAVDLEAKLAAAEQALEPFAEHANDRAVDDTGWRDKDTVKIVVSIGDLRQVRAALEGKPS